MKFTCSGSHKRASFVKDVADDGSRILIVSGETDVQDEINSHAEEVDIKRLLRAATLGDLSGLNARVPLNDGENVLDVSNLNKTINEVNEDGLNTLAVLRDAYNKYPAKDSISFTDFKNKIISGDISGLEALASPKIDTQEVKE